jgi:hypothetical protein
MICPLCGSAFNQICKACEFGFAENGEVKQREAVFAQDENEHWNQSGTVSMPIRYED